MAATVDNYPGRYALSPIEKKSVAAKFKARGGATDRELAALSKRMGVAKKTIFSVLNELRLPLIPEQRQTSKRPTATPKAKPARKSPKEAAEAFFKPPSPEIVDPPAPETASMDDSRLDELALLEKVLREDHEKILQSMLDLEAEMRAEKETAAKERQRAEDAIKQTAALRMATRADREELEALRGQVSSAERRFRKQKERADFANRELALSVKREKLLLNALEKSEADLAARG